MCPSPSPDSGSSSALQHSYAMDNTLSALAPPPPPPPPPPPTLPEKRTSQILRQLDDLLQKYDKENKMKLGVENMLEVYLKDKKRTKDLEAQLDLYNTTINDIVKRIEYIRTNAGALGPDISKRLKEHNYSGNTSLFSTTALPTITSRSRTKPRSNSSPNIKGKQKASHESISFPDDDAWPISKRINHIITQLRIDEWKEAEPGASAEATALKESKLDKLNTLLRILKNTADIDNHYPKKKIAISLRQCITSPNLEIRVMGLRTLRHLVESPDDVELIASLQIDIFIVRALAREGSANEPECEQTLKLVRAFIEYGGLKYINQGIVRAVVAIAEQMDNRLRNVSLETLAELAILDIGLTVRSGGVRVLMQALLDGQLHMAEVLVHALVYVLDTPGRRCYLRPGVDLEMIIAPFTESGKGSNYEERLKNSARVVTLLLKTWPGVFCMCANNLRAARSVVQALRNPAPETKKIALDMFFDIFRVKLPKDYNNFLSGRQHTVQVAPSTSDSDKPGVGRASPALNNTIMLNDTLNDTILDTGGRVAGSNAGLLKMLDHHLCVILIIFIDADILMALIDMVKSDEVYISRKATLLIGEILQLSTRLLPIMMGIQVQSLPKLFALASNFEDEQVRHNATTALAHIDRLTRARSRYAAPAVATATKGTTLRAQEKVHEVKLKIGYAIDDVHFRQLLMDTQVLNTKDYTKWSWESISELLQGPLLNPRRLDEAMRGKKFIKRLLAFYRPFSHRFSDINATKANVSRYVRTGCTLITALLSNPDGVRYLSENKLLGQIAEALSEVDPLKSGDAEVEPIFSMERMDTTLSGGYFTLLGTFSKNKDGVRILEKFKIFSLFYELSELRNRDDLKVAMVTNLDYALDGHPRVLLSKIMTSGYNPIRLFATQYLGVIMRRSEREYNDWIIRLLLTQLYDTHLEVCQVAVSLLDEACEKQANLELLVKYRPSLGHLGEIGNPLLLRFLSTSTGFRYLYDLGYVQKEMDDWFEFRNQQYVTQLELSLARALANTPDRKDANPFEERVDSENNYETLQPGDGFSPPHFYGELTKTEEGCQLLRDKGHFQLFVQHIRSYSLESQDMDALQQLKAVLWAVGNIGATKNGLPFLEDEDVVKDIVHMAENSNILSLKGTCYYVLGLVAKTRQGMELLGELGWEGVECSNGRAEGLCVPLNLRNFLAIRDWKYTTSLSDPPRISAAITRDPVAVDILRHIGDMSNHILSGEAIKQLAKIRYRHPEHFRRVDVFYAVCQYMGSYHFRLPSRKYILDFFEMRFDPSLLQQLDTLVEKEFLLQQQQQQQPHASPSQHSSQESVSSSQNDKKNNDTNEVHESAVPINPPAGVNPPGNEHQVDTAPIPLPPPPPNITGLAPERLEPICRSVGFM